MRKSVPSASARSYSILGLIGVRRSRVLVDCRPQNPSIATPRSARCSGVMLSESGPRRCDCRKPLAPRSPVTLRIFSAKTGAYSTQCPSPSMTGCVSPLRISSGVWCELIWRLPDRVKCDCAGAYAPGTTQVKLIVDTEESMSASVCDFTFLKGVEGFGEARAFRQNRAFDMIAQACGGTFSVTGDKNGPPTRPGISIGDTGTGMLMAITILGALYKRRETGEGHRLQVAMQDAMLHYMRINFATQGLTGKAAERGGSKVPGVSNAPMGVYPCAPGGPNDYVYIMTSRANPDHWDRLLKLIDRQDLIGDKRYLTPAARVDREAEVDEVISVWTRKHTKLDAMKLLGDAGLPAGAVLDTDELNKDVTFEQRGIMQTMIHPVHRPFKMPGWPVRVDGKATRITSSPMLGEHTDQVLSEWLGLSAQAVAEMKREGVI